MSIAYFWYTELVPPSLGVRVKYEALETIPIEYEQGAWQTNLRLKNFKFINKNHYQSIERSNNFRIENF